MRRVMLDPLHLALAGLAAVAAGVVNALAGGGTLITFPTLTALGVPVVAANVTNTIALCPGYLGGSFAQARDLRGQKRRVWMLVPAAVVGGLAGGALLLQTGEKTFREIVPFLILLASSLLAVQESLRRWLGKRARNGGGQAAPAGESPASAIAPVVAGTVYGGYFGAGLGVVLLAVLGLALDDSLTRLNALKQTLSLAANVTAALFFVFSAQVVWPAAVVMAVGALIGGSLGGRLAGRVRPQVLRWIVVAIGVVVAIAFWVKVT
jgi:uncharacterized membrane protein YfcA